jgi:hypothetical protein
MDVKQEVLNLKGVRNLGEFLHYVRSYRTMTGQEASQAVLSPFVALNIMRGINKKLFPKLLKDYRDNGNKAFIGLTIANIKIIVED